MARLQSWSECVAKHAQCFTLFGIISACRSAIPDSRALGLLMLLSAMFCLGSSFVAAKFVITTFPTYLALESRLLLAALILSPYIIDEKFTCLRLDADIFWLVLCQSLFGMVAFNVFFFDSITHTSAVMVAIVYGTLPIMIAFLARFMLGETLSPRACAGIALAGLGAILAGVDPERGLGPGLPVGTVLLVGVVACAALFTIIGKRLSTMLAPISLTALLNLLAAVIVLPLAAGEAWRFPFGPISLQEWGALAFWATLSGVLYPALWHAGLARVEAQAAGIFTGAAMLVAVVGSSLFANEPLGWRQITGIVLIIVALGSASRWSRFRGRPVSVNRENYNGGYSPSGTSVARHAYELVAGPWRRQFPRPPVAVEGGKDFKVEYRRKWKDGPATVEIYFQKRPVFSARLDPNWERNDRNIHAEFVANDSSWAERFMELGCPYARALPVDGRPITGMVLDINSAGAGN